MENFEAKDDSKSSKSLEAPQGAQVVTSCCQRMVRSFVETIYSDTVFRMILLSLRCTKGVYPCWETLGVKKPSFGDIIIRKHHFFTNTSNQRQATHTNFSCQWYTSFAFACGSYIMYSSPPPKQTTHRMNNMYHLGWCGLLLCSWGRWA